jgi:choline transport protein
MAELEKHQEPRRSTSSTRNPQEIFEKQTSNLVASLNGEEVNASGYRDELDRQYGIWSLMGLALTIDNAWVALGGSIIIASCKEEIKITAMSVNMSSVS